MSVYTPERFAKSAFEMSMMMESAAKLIAITGNKSLADQFMDVRGLVVLCDPSTYDPRNTARTMGFVHDCREGVEKGLDILRDFYSAQKDAGTYLLIASAFLPKLLEFETDVKMWENLTKT
jgi:hypothetical protein